MNGLKTILVVDDDLSARELIEYAFVKKGYDVVLAETPEKGWEVLEHNKKIGLALIDINYGKESFQNGFTLVEKIRAHPEIKVPYFLISVDATEEEKRRAERLGTLGCLDKEIEGLIESVRSIKLGNSRNKTYG